MEETHFFVKMRCFSEQRLSLDFGGGRVTVCPSSDDAFLSPPSHCSMSTLRSKAEANHQAP